jgi:hypothetical protein
MEGCINYNDATTNGIPTWITFTSATRLYDWIAASNSGKATLTLQGAL